MNNTHFFTRFSCICICHKEHPSCFSPALTEKAKETVRKYEWQCRECKQCMVCADNGQESELLICDDCDRGCHTFCAVPKLKAIPEGTNVHYILSQFVVDTAHRIMEVSFV